MEDHRAPRPIQECMEVSRKRRQRGGELFRSMARGSDLRHITQKTWELRNNSIRCSESMDSLTVVLYGDGCSLKPGKNRAIIAVSVGESPSWLRHWILIPACEGSNPSSPANKYKSPDCLCSRGFFFVFNTAPDLLLTPRRGRQIGCSAAIDRRLCNECATKPEKVRLSASRGFIDVGARPGSWKSMNRRSVAGAASQRGAQVTHAGATFSVQGFDQVADQA